MTFTPVKHQKRLASGQILAELTNQSRRRSNLQAEGESHSFRDQLGKGPKSELLLTVNGQPCRIARYEMITGSAVVPQYMSDGRGGGQTVYQNVNTTDDYYFAFRDDTLLFWGLLHEFHRSSNEEVREIGTMIESASD